MSKVPKIELPTRADLTIHRLDPARPSHVALLRLAEDLRSETAMRAIFAPKMPVRFARPVPPPVPAEPEAPALAETDDPADWIVLGKTCTWEGSLDEAAWLVPDEDARAAIATGQPPDLSRSIGCCPFCRGELGKFPRAQWQELLEQRTAQVTVEPELFRDMVAWKPARCFPTPRDKARAYLAHLARETKAARRRGLN